MLIKMYSFYISDEFYAELKNKYTEEEIDDIYYEKSRRHELEKLDAERAARQSEREKEKQKQKEKFRTIK